MSPSKGALSTLAQKCKTILASNWVGQLNTIKADAKGSKEDIYTSKVKYMLKRGRPYIWIPEKELHNVNTVIDERGSFGVTAPVPGPLVHFFRSTKKLPARVALIGDIVRLSEEKVPLAVENLNKVIASEESTISESTYTVSGVLSSSNHFTTSRAESFKELVNADDNYAVYRFNPRSCTFFDRDGGGHEVDLEAIEASKVDPLARFSAKLIDGINQTDARRRALALFCFTSLNVHARDAYMLSVDRKGFDVVAMVRSPVIKDGVGEYEWKEYRFNFKSEANDLETFCSRLVEMEEEVVNKISSYSGLNGT